MSIGSKGLDMLCDLELFAEGLGLAKMRVVIEQNKII